jgi:hypothetical protein
VPESELNTELQRAQRIVGERGDDECFFCHGCGTVDGEGSGELEERAKRAELEAKKSEEEEAALMVSKLDGLFVCSFVRSFVRSFVQPTN